MIDDKFYQKKIIDQFVSLITEIQRLNKQVRKVEYSIQASTDKVCFQKRFDRIDARELTIHKLQLALPQSNIEVCAKRDGNGIKIVSPEERYYDPYREEEVITRPQTTYLCKFYYGKAFNVNSPHSWNTVNMDSLDYDGYIFTMSIDPNALDWETFSCPNDDDPNLYYFVFSKYQLLQLIEDSNKQPDKLGKYHFTFNLRMIDGVTKVYETRDEEVDVSYCLNNFQVFLPKSTGINDEVMLANNVSTHDAMNNVSDISSYRPK